MVERFEFYKGVYPQTSEENAGRLPHARKEGAEYMPQTEECFNVIDDLTCLERGSPTPCEHCIAREARTEPGLEMFDELEIFRDDTSGTDHLFIPDDETRMTLCGESIDGLTLLLDPLQAENLCGECDVEAQRIESGDIHEPDFVPQLSDEDKIRAKGMGIVGAAILEKVWECRNCSAWGTDRQSGVDHSVDLGHGIRNLKEAAGLISPQSPQQIDTGRLPHARKEGAGMNIQQALAIFEDLINQMDEEMGGSQDLSAEREALALLKQMGEEMGDYQDLNAEREALAFLKSFQSKTGAGPISPQQMAVQNVQHSQAPNAPQQNQQQPVPPGEPQKGPPLAIVPSGTGDEQAMKHTVPPELPNSRYYMAGWEKKSSVNGRFSYKVRRK